MSTGATNLRTVFLSFILFFSLAGSIGVSEAHILIIGDSANDFPLSYQETSQLAADLRQRGYPVLDLYRNNATTENILKGMYGADVVIYAGHGGYQSGHYNMVGGTASPPFSLVGSNDFIWGIGGQMREGWYGNLFTAPFKEEIPVFLLHACFSTGRVESYQVANPVETIYNFAQMFNGAGANYYATAWNGAEIIYDFLNGASNFQDANNQNKEKIITSNLYNGVQVWRNNNGYAAFVGDWNGVFPSVGQTTAYDETAADAWYHGDRKLSTSLYVDANMGNDSWDGTRATFMGGTTGPMKTITATLNALISWGTINVASGTYNENLIINKKIYLRGSGVNTVITPSNLENPIINITSSGNASLISGFILSGATTSSAVVISGGSGCSITNNNITGNQIGILISGSSNTISSNNISDNSNGVYVERGNNQNIKNNTITHSSTGVTVKNSKNVKIEDNRINSNTGTGVTIKGSNNTTIQRNNISNNQNGLEISDNSAGNIAANNTITNNQNSGVEIRQSQNNQIKHNNIQNNGETGIKLNQSTGNIINNGNNINGSNIGISIHNNSNFNSINSNTISAKDLIINSSNSSGNNITNNKVTFHTPWISAAATEVAIFVEMNNRLPDNILIGGVNVPMPSFLELLTTVTLKIYHKDYSSTDLAVNYKNALAPKDSQKRGTMSLAGYILIAGKVKDYMDRKLIAPNYSSASNLGTYFGYHNLIYTYSKILDSYNATATLPDRVAIVPWSFIVNYAGTFTIDQTVDAASWVKNYIETYHKLPGSVSITGTILQGTTITKQIPMPAFLELLTTVTLKINKTDNTPVDLAGNFKNPIAPKDSQKKGNMSLSKYMGIAGKVKDYLDRYLIAPNYSSYSNLGTYFGYQNLIYTYSKILDSYSTANPQKLPDNIVILPWSLVVNYTGTFTIEETVDAATWVKNYIETNQKLPVTVTINGTNLQGATITQQISMPTFLELLTTVILKINKNEISTTELAGNYKNALAPKDSQKKGTMTLARYIEIAGKVKDYMDRNLIAPNYSSYSNLGTYFGYQNLIYTYSNILDTYNTTKTLPPVTTIRPWAEITSPPSPSSTVKITFIHHSCGSNWLSDGNGNLGAFLNANNYYVTDTNYDWDAEPDDNLGDHTNTDDWALWFNDLKMPYVYNNNAETVYTNTIANPGGENEIIMFKSCYPLSEVGSSINDEKATYNDLKTYFAAHPDKMFVLITPPGETTVSSYQLTRNLCNWLVDTENGWLSDYTGNNVYVFDFYCVLSEANSHHRWNNGQIEHVYASDYNGVSPYHNGDDHPNSAGNQKATNEYITFLNYAYNQWKS